MALYVAFFTHTSDSGVALPLKISVVIPVFNAKSHLDSLVDNLTVLPRYFPDGHEVIFVDDHSSDGTGHFLIELLKRTDLEAHIVTLHKNVGQVEATAIGIAAARNDVVVTMDDDLQHPVAEIPKLASALQESDFDFVVGKFFEIQQPTLRRFASSLATRIARSTLRTPKDHFFSSFIAFRRDFLQQVDVLNLPQLEIGWMYGYSQRFGNVDVSQERSARGHSTYRVRGLLKTARPLFKYLLGSIVQPMIVLALFLFAASILLAGFYLFQYFRTGQLLPGFVTLSLIGLVNLAVVSLSLATVIRLLLALNSVLRSGSLKNIPVSIQNSSRHFDHDK